MSIIYYVLGIYIIYSWGVCSYWLFGQMHWVSSISLSFLHCSTLSFFPLENSDDSSRGGAPSSSLGNNHNHDVPTCYMCFDEEDSPSNPMITPCKCLGTYIVSSSIQKFAHCYNFFDLSTSNENSPSLVFFHLLIQSIVYGVGDTRYVHVDCLRKWHTAEADNQVCFLSSVDATCSVCKTTFRSDFKLKDGRLVKLFKSSLEPPYVSLLVATKHEMAQRLFNTRFQLSFSTLLKPDGRNGTRPLLLGRSSGSDMVLDYRTVSARHATIRFKNGEFLFTDAGSSNGSYLYLRRPVELSSNQSVQFRLGRSMISMKVVNKWNRRILRAVSRRTGLGSGTSNNSNSISGEQDDHSVGSNENDVRITDNDGEIIQTVPRRTRENIMASMPSMGTLSQASPQHLDLLYALAYPSKAKKEAQTNNSKVAPQLLEDASNCIDHEVSLARAAGLDSAKDEASGEVPGSADGN